MQTKNDKLNKIVIGSVMATSAVLLASSGLALKPALKVYANASPSVISIDNSSFASGTNSPSNWQAISNQASSVVARVINTDANKFEENKNDYKLQINPGKVSTASSSDNNVFMINSQNVAVSYGYQSNSFELASNGYYVISVPVRTQDAGWASVYLVDDSKDFKLKCENITSTSSYTTYTFYVATNSNSLNVNLQVYLGSENNTSKGAVFFDEIKAYSYAESTFFSLYNSRNSNSAESVNSYRTWQWSMEDNADLVKLSEDGYNANADGFIQRVFSLQDGTVLPEGVLNPTTGNLIQNDYALLLKNSSSASVGVRRGNAFNFAQYDYVLYSTYVKTNTSSGGITIKLVEEDEDGNFIQVGDAISNFTTSGNDDKLNGWKKVTFAVKASAFQSKSLYAEYWLGNSSTHAQGYAFVGKEVFTPISSAEYENLTTSSSLVKVSLDDITEDSSSFSNHSFNNFEKPESETANNAFIKPANLEKLDSYANNYGEYNGETFASGIINTNSSAFSSASYPFANPGLTPNQSHSDISTQTNNVLAIYQNSNAYQGYNTQSVKLTAKSYYKVSVYVKTQVYSSLSKGIDTVNGGARWALTYNNVALSEFNHVVSNSEWTTLSTYIQTGLDDMEITAQLSLGNSDKKCAGTAFFDDMVVETATENEFNNAVKSNFIDVVNLKKDSFNLVSENKNGYGLYQSKNWQTTQNNVNSVSGVFDTQNTSNEVMNNVFPGMQNPTRDGVKNVLLINNKADLATSYSNTFTQKLESGSYYKVSVWAKTYNLGQSEVNVSYEDEEQTKAIPYGAFISINNVEEKFDALTNTEWKEYIFYINSDTDIDLKLNLGLGSENALTNGYVYFSDVTVESMEEDAYTAATSAYTEDNIPSHIRLVKTATVENDGDDTQSPETNGELNYLVIPTLITAMALIIAIIGTVLRQINFNKFVKLKKKSNSYDRRKTQTKSVRRAEIENIVKTKVEELNKKLAQLEQQKAVQESDVLKAKEAYLAYKNKKLDKQGRKAKKQAKNNYYNAYNALSNTYVDINIIKDDIAKIKSEKYILKEEYMLMVNEWREERKARSLERKNQKAKQKLKK